MLKVLAEGIFLEPSKKASVFKVVVYNRLS